ncbi:MFS transporter [Frankia sp. CNm7]|uniref:MFS transporter n=1 Tax=Frankia nepalensis TaxID=1836974 RepID=A0A937RDK8_9ACTN|nr:MFS transporter [Frankia nepalensis]MBL7501421.1 MFS transporter [Frankia nepalensis]MBL7510016.1 MFS transporter [Frankia nepalensis]MBL7517132.1 MFS transporter [Frankia nepalensis]MBL7627972.1 MFS transporter [Frankia nepalensis]
MRKWLPLLTVCLGTFMLLIDVTIVNVALPSMVTDLDASFGALQWVIDAYALALAALVLGAGSVADIIGHRRTYVAGLALFAVSSLLCGLAPDPGLLVAARALQGVGAAAMFATNFPLLNASHTGRDRGIAYGLWGAVAGASSAIGPIVGGVLTEYISWRWIFFVNLPVSAVAIGLALTKLADARAQTRVRVDVPGIATFTAAAASATYALIRANEDGWSDLGVWALLGATIVLLAVFVLLERRSDHPMFDLALLRNRSFVGVLIAGLLMTFAAFSAFTYTSIWLQSVLGMSPLEAGLTGLPLSITAFFVSALLGRFLHEARPDLVIGGGLAFIGVGGVVGALLVHGSASWPALIPGFAIVGIGVGMVTPMLGSVSMSLVPLQRTGMAAGALNTTRQLGFAFGIAAMGSVFVALSRHSLSGDGVPADSGIAHAIAGGQAAEVVRAAPVLDPAVHAAAVTGVQATFAMAGAIGLVATVAVLVLMRPTKPAAATAGRPGQRPAVPASS